MNVMTVVENDVDTNQIKIAASDVQVYYGDTHAIKDVNVQIEDKTVTAFIGPSGCGKTTTMRMVGSSLADPYVSVGAAIAALRGPKHGGATEMVLDMLNEIGDPKNVPQFIEVDLEAKRLATTEASGENRQTPIEHLRRVDGNIVFHGFEMGRAFSWVIDEASGRVTVAIATDGISVAIFGACTPAAGDGKE